MSSAKRGNTSTPHSPHIPLNKRANINMTSRTKAIEGKDGDASSSEAKQDVIGDRELANTYSRTMMSAKLLRLQTTEEGQAGFGAEQLKVVLNAFFKVRDVLAFFV